MFLPNTTYAQELPRGDFPVLPTAENGWDGEVEANGTTEEVLPPNNDLTLTGIYDANSAVLYAYNGGIINMINGGSLTMNGTSNIGAATAGTNGTINMDGVNITAGVTGGAYQTGLYAVNDGKIDFNQGAISTGGTYGMGVLASNGGEVTVRNTQINTVGIGAAGVNVGAAGTVTLENTTITTTNPDEGYGIFALYGGQAEMTGGSITVNSTGVFARRASANAGTASTIVLNNVTVKTQGPNQSIGLRSWEEDSHIIMTEGSVTTTGDNSYGAMAHAGSGTNPGGTVTLNNSSITTSGNASHGLLVYDRSFGVLNGGSITVDGSRGSYAIYTTGGGDVNGAGVYNITGDIRNQANGTIALDFQGVSRFKGGSAVGTGAIDFTMADSTWIMDKDSTLTSLNMTGGRVNELRH